MRIPSARTRGRPVTLAHIRRARSITAILAALGLAACGSSGGSAATTTTHHTRPSGAPAARARAPQKVVYKQLYSLPAAVQDPAIAALGDGKFVLLGGIDSADTSTADIVVADRQGPVRTASLPGAQHDAQAALLDGTVYVFGGGEFTQYDHILGFDPASATVSTAGTLPTPASDVAVTRVGQTAYVVGGFDGTNWLDTILAWRPGAAVTVAAHLPVPLRYAAVTAAGGKVLIAGGSTPTAASDAIYSFDPSTGTVKQIGKLPQLLTHAGAATLDGIVYVVGGRGDNLDSQTRDIWAIDPATGAVRPIGRLPQPLSDAGVATVGGGIVVAGGRGAAGTQASVGELVPAG